MNRPTTTDLITAKIRSTKAAAIEGLMGMDLARAGFAAAGAASGLFATQTGVADIAVFAGLGLMSLTSVIAKHLGHTPQAVAQRFGASKTAQAMIKHAETEQAQTVKWQKRTLGGAVLLAGVSYNMPVVAGFAFAGYFLQKAMRTNYAQDIAKQIVQNNETAKFRKQDQEFNLAETRKPEMVGALAAVKHAFRAKKAQKLSV